MGKNQFCRLTGDTANTELQPQSPRSPPWYHPFKISSLGKVGDFCSYMTSPNCRLCRSVVLCLQVIRHMWSPWLGATLSINAQASLEEKNTILNIFKALIVIPWQILTLCCALLSCSVVSDSLSPMDLGPELSVMGFSGRILE